MGSLVSRRPLDILVARGQADCNCCRDPRPCVSSRGGDPPCISSSLLEHWFGFRNVHEGFNPKQRGWASGRRVDSRAIRLRIGTRIRQSQGQGGVKSGEQRRRLDGSDKQKGSNNVPNGACHQRNKSRSRQSINPGPHYSFAPSLPPLFRLA
jgi:hypothetical protein